MVRDIYTYKDYKKFLNDSLDDLDQGGRGSRARMSRAIGCQTAYTAKVLRGPAHFNLEQGEALIDFLGLTEEQANYFLLLLLEARAGTPKLRLRYERQRQAILKEKLLLKNKLGIESHLEERDQFIYYSAWYFSAIHALTAIPGFQRPEQIAKRLNISLRQASDALEFLLRTGLLVREKKGELKIGKYQIHLGANSPLITKHHMNWRLRAMQAVENQLEAGVHYSAVVSISKNDEEKVKEKIAETIRWILSLVKDSKEEELCGLSLDFYQV